MNKYERVTEQNGMLDCMYQCGNDMSCFGCGARVGEAIIRLAELEDKIENGTLVELPCKIGDVVYQLRGFLGGEHLWHIMEFKVNSMTLNADGRIEVFGEDDYELELDTIYVTKEQAEARLRELRGEKK